MALLAILQLLDHHPTLAHIQTSQFLQFIRLASLLKRDIDLAQPARHDLDVAPTYMPTSVSHFLSNAVGMSVDEVEDLWGVLKEEVWFSESQDRQSADEETTFRTHGWHLGITSLTIYPPTRSCTNSDCPRFGAPLKRAEQRQVIVYSLALGARPAWSIHMYCQHCKTNYHNNFSVNGGTRTYYQGIPNLIQIGEHQFAELKLVNMWISSMLLGWFSATNSAKLYDISLSDRHNLETGGWQFGLKLTTNHIWDAFTIKSLLDDCDRNAKLLQVAHVGDQDTRFKAAMEARNERMILQGQDEVPHYCDRCMRVWKDEDGNLPMGTTWVIPAAENFAVPSLQSKRGRRHFCTKHDHLHSICAVVGCENLTIEGTKACTVPAHQEMERLNSERGKAAFTLKHRLQRQKIRNAMASAPPTGPPIDDESGDDDDDDDEIQENIEWFDIEEDGSVHRYEGRNLWSVGVADDDTEMTDPCDPKSELGNRKIKALFHRRRTHNEQILVRPCGVIFARATFFGAEAVSNVLLFVKNAFSVPGAHKPDHFIYDTNCDAKQQVMKDGDPWWDSVGMCVDVWHFLNKHKISHEFCQKYCNPADYPELLSEDGKTWLSSMSCKRSSSASRSASRKSHSARGSWNEELGT
ncbi:hypothetical protein C8R43DRAFT_1138890 [Mycena crocata]|nr:hypothetical protein C8R43DRAFT_1138890 [Mycena crocata]